MRQKIQKGKTHELTEIDTQFVSLVTAGANRQSNFLIVKSDENGSEPTPGSGKNSSGDTNNGGNTPDDTDMSAWLDSTEKSLEESLFSAELDSLMNSIGNNIPDDGESHGVVGKGDSPPKKKTTPGKQKTVKSSDDELVKLRKQLKEEKLRNARLKKTIIGGSTTLLTGEVNHGSIESVDKANSEKVVKWRSGQDLAG